MPRKEEDSLGQDFTRAGEPESPKPPESQRSLGDQSTFGDAGSSVSDVGGLDDTLDSDMEVVDLSDRYEIEGVIGKGGMGEVLRAYDTRLGRPVAIKRILGQMARSKKALARFLTEARSVAKLNHFNIVQIYDYGRAADGPFIVMELVEGQSLQENLKEGPLELEAAVEMTCQLCDALSTAHEAGIIHRDIKPANILLTQRGEPKLTDFGLARQETADHGQTQKRTILGTLVYMAPEQSQDGTLADARSDLWSLAATLYQMVTGKTPKVIRLHDVPQELQEILSKALEDDKDARYQTAAQFRNVLQGCLQIDEPVLDLTVGFRVGMCPKCHLKNQSDSKFCRGCGDSLRVLCLSCSANLPVWEDICGYCGGDQKELASTQRVVNITNSIGMQLNLIQSGEFKRTLPNLLSWFFKPQQVVRITKQFYLSAHQVTQEQYEQVMGVRPWHGKLGWQEGANYPATYVNWNDAVEFCRKLSDAEGAKYRLPTEGEWEYACRGGTTTDYFFGNNASQLGEYCWYRENSEGTKHAVGKKIPNPWGLYDMHGNVFEWCQDWYAEYLWGLDFVDPTGPAGGMSRVLRGGSYSGFPRFVRSASRDYERSDYGRSNIGFRVARTYNLSP